MHRTQPESSIFGTRRRELWFEARKSPPVSLWVYTVSAKLTQHRNREDPLPELTTEVERLSLVIEIGGMPVRVNTTDPGFLAMLQDRYAGFLALDRTQQRLNSMSTSARACLPRSRRRRACDPAPRPLDLGARRFSRRVGARARALAGFARPPIPIPSTPCCASCTRSCWPAREASCCIPPAPSATARRSCSQAFPGGQDDHFPPGSSRRHAADRRNFLRAQAGCGLHRLRHAVYRRTGQAGRKCFGASRRTLPAGQGFRESHRSAFRPPRRRDLCLLIFSFSRRMRNWCSRLFIPPLSL